MKKYVLIYLFVATNAVFAQTITYSNFSRSLSDTLKVKVADNNSFNLSLPTITGNGVTWDASALTVAVGLPSINLVYATPSATPNGNLYPNSNQCNYDPALTSVVSYEYYNFSPDSISHWGSYEPNAAHEVFQNPDKRLVFPFNYGQSFTDTYNKTNYSNHTTISSYQNGSRTVTFVGYGTLILPQTTFTNVALISEERTNSLGPNSFEYTWYEVSSGKKLLYRKENNGSIRTAFCVDIATEISEDDTETAFGLFPNPAEDHLSVQLTNTQTIIKSVEITDLIGKAYPFTGNQTNNILSLQLNDLPSGFYLLKINTNKSSITQKIIKQ